MDKLEEYFRRDFSNDFARVLTEENNPQATAFNSHLRDILYRAVRGGKDGFYFTPQDLGYVEIFLQVGLLEEIKVGNSTIYSPMQKAIDLVGLTD